MTVDGLPAPLVPADVDLRGLEYMPLLGHHLLGSTFHAMCTDEEWRIGVTLWWASWNQVPAASLPDDDVALTRLADLGRDIKTFKRVREKALHGFVKCSDGRLYHRFLSKQALIAWEKRSGVMQEKSSELTRKKRERERRSRMFADLEEAGVTPPWNTSTAELSRLHAQHIPKPVTPPVTPPVTEDGVTGVTGPEPVTVTGTAKTGRDVTGRDVTPKPIEPPGGGDTSQTSDPPPPPDPREPSSMRADWQPSPHIASLAKQAGVRPDDVDATVPEFVAYWLTRPDMLRTQHEWDHALIRALKVDKARAASAPAGAPHGARQANPRPSKPGRLGSIVAQLAGTATGDPDDERPPIDGTAERVG